MRSRGLGTCARRLVEEVAAIKSMDVVLPVRRGEQVAPLCLRPVARPVARPERRVAQLLARLELELPARNSLKPLPRQLDVARVKIDPDQEPVGRYPPQQLRRMPAEAQRAIDDHLSRPWVERGEHIAHEYGDMWPVHQKMVGEPGSRSNPCWAPKRASPQLGEATVCRQINSRRATPL